VQVDAQPGVRWFGAHEALWVRRADEPPRGKVAGFDLDGVLLRSTVPFGQYAARLRST
jgi:hypothetical protein